MPGTFVVLSESAAVMANCDNHLFEVDKFEGRTLWARRRRAPPCSFRSSRCGDSRSNYLKNRIKRILREHVLDVGDQQFLMLLLMMKSENDFFFQAEDGIRDGHVTGVQTCALPISSPSGTPRPSSPGGA